MRINKVRILNFRNYFGDHVFDLSKKITILYGENGYGKSTFFDAIEYCLTDSISRLSYNEKNTIKEDLMNRFALVNGNECKVVIEFDNYKLMRGFSFYDGEFSNVRAQVTNLNGEVLRDNYGRLINSKQKVEEFFMSNMGNNIYEKNTFGNLMKQAYILSQEQVTDFIMYDDPSKRFRSMADIVGFKPLLNLSDNTKKVLNGIKKEYKSFEDKKVIKDEQIKSKEETKFPIDTFTLSNLLNELSVDYNSDDLEAELNKLLNDNINQKQLYKHHLQQMKDLIPNYFSASDISEKLFFAKDLEKNRRNKLNSLENLIKKIKDKKNSYLDKRQKYIELSEREKSIATSENKLKELGYNNMDLKKLHSLKEQIQEIFNQINFAILNYKEFYSYSGNITKGPVTLKGITKVTDSIEKRINKRNNIIKKIDNLLINDNQGLLKVLINGINDINKYLHTDFYNGYCPVCSTFKGEQISEETRKNLLEYQNKLNINTEYTDRLLYLKNKLKMNVKELENKKERLEGQATSLTLQIENSKKESSVILNNKYFNENYFNISFKSLSDEERLIKDKLNLLNNVISLRHELDNLIEKNKISDKQGNLNLEKINYEISLLNRVLNRVNEYYLVQKDKLKEYSDEYEEVQKVFTNIKTIIGKQDWEISFETLIERYRSKIKKFEYDIKKISEAKNQVSYLKNNTQIEQQIKKLEKESKNLSENMRTLHKVIKEIEKYMEKVFGEFSNNTMDYFNSLSSPIQKYYRYLNPLPSNSYLKFEGDDQKLWINVQYNDSEKGLNHSSLAKNVLSSGQLNVLAVAIFLAINEAQRVNEIDFIGIDDPIQNMDDVNQYSICDILGNINKQLIFSTHDMDFLKLFIKKNQYQLQDIQVYNFTSPYLNEDKVEKILLG